MVESFLVVQITQNVGILERCEGEKTAQSGSRGFFSPGPHTTRYAGPHRAVHRDYRAVAG
jgi:hypothetical protein